MKAKKFPSSLLAIVAATLAMVGCGGGSGGNDPVIITSTSAGSAEKDVTVKPGDNFSFTAVAESPDSVMKSMAWSVQASANAPTIAVSNMDCESAEKVDTPRQNNLVTSLWKCTISGAAPKLLEKDATYSFTASATNSKGSTASVSSVLKVQASPSGALIPKVTVNAPATAVGGETKELSCSATGGVVSPGEAAKYTYTWSSSTVNGYKVTFDDRKSAKVKATFPKMPGKVSMIVNCDAEDSAGNVGQDSAVVEVAHVGLDVSVSGVFSGVSGQTIAMECSVNGDSGGKYTYKWSSIAVGGAELVFTPYDRKVVSVTLPTVKSPTSLVASCEVTDEFGSTGMAAKGVDISPLVEPAPAPDPVPAH